MKTGNANEKALKQLEKEIVLLEKQQTELIRKKWDLEDRIRKQQVLIQRLQYEGGEAKSTLSLWKKVALILGVTWAIVLSFFNIEKK